MMNIDAIRLIRAAARSAAGLGLRGDLRAHFCTIERETLPLLRARLLRRAEQCSDVIDAAIRDHALHLVGAGDVLQGVAVE